MREDSAPLNNDNKPVADDRKRRKEE